MLSSLWNQITGNSFDEEDEDDDHDHDHDFDEHDNDQAVKPVTVPDHAIQTEEDRIAASLLSQFPPYGTYSSSLRKQQQHQQSQHSPLSTSSDALTGNRSSTNSPANRGSRSGKSQQHRVHAKGSGVITSPLHHRQPEGGGDLDAGKHKEGGDDDGQFLGPSDKQDGRRKKASASAGEQTNVNSFWGDDEMTLWRSSTQKNNMSGSNGDRNRNQKNSNKSIRRKRKQNSRQKGRRGGKHKRHNSDDLIRSAELRRQWIFGKFEQPPPNSNNNANPNIPGGLPTNGENHNNPMLSPPAPSPSGSRGKAGKASISSTRNNTGTPNSQQHFTFSFDQGSVEDSTSSTDYDDDDDDDSISASPSYTSSPETPNAKKAAEDMATTTNNSNTNNTLVLGEKKGWHLDEKHHWMPDKLCKECFACEAQFTVFRRRHHCRLCGQVFCSNCSSYFVEIEGDRIGNHNDVIHHDSTEITGPPRNIRACKICYDNVASGAYKLFGDHNMEERDMVIMTESLKDSRPSSANSGENKNYKANNSTREKSFSSAEVLGNSLRSLHSKTEDNDVKRGSGTNDSDDSLSVTSSISQQLAGFHGAGSSKEFENLALVKQKLEEERLKREEDERAERMKITEGDDDNKVGLIGKTISSSITRRFGRLAESAAREAQVGDAGFNDDDAKLVGTGVKAPEENENQQGKEEKGVNPPNVENEGEIGLSKNNFSNLKEQNMQEKVKLANRQLGLAAANHLEKIGRELLRSEAPLLLKEIDDDDKSFDKWVNMLMMLASRCSATVSPNVRVGDKLAIQPYCKVALIPGGKVLEDSAYMSGVIFHKNVIHKTMAKEILNPRIMLVSGGIEYTRQEQHKIASLEILLEQEAKFMEIIVTKITKLRPNVLIVERSVSRKAQELILSKTNIVLIQGVKTALMERIERQTGAKILSITNHLMNQFGSSILGKCKRFRLVTFRDNEVWHGKENNSDNASGQQNQVPASNTSSKGTVDALLSNSKMANHQRQAVLAANLLGETVYDGSEAVKRGLAKRGVSVTYIMIEGCPSHLGCSVVLRGASRAALKQVKQVFQFLVNAAYNLKLETSYLRARRAMLPPDYESATYPATSCSLCVDYGPPPQGRKVRPWVGGKGDLVCKPVSGKITAFDYQSILISSVWMAGKTLCCPAAIKEFHFYSQQDFSLGQFLRDSCFNLQMKCPNASCKHSALDHTLSFIHNDGVINIKVEKMEDPLPAEKKNGPSGASTDESEGNAKQRSSIATWSYCLNCCKVVTPLTYITENTWKLSFGKFLEIFFYNKGMVMNSPEHNCNCCLQSASSLFFGCGHLAARFTYERIRPYSVYLRKFLPSDDIFHRDNTFLELDIISTAATELFSKFDDQIARISSDTRQLFGSAANQPEHLQTVLSELNTIGSESRRASKILQDKIVSVINRYRESQQESATSYGEGSRMKALETFMYFPWHSRRYIFMLASAWNERLTAIGQALASMKKLASSSQYGSGRTDIVLGPNANTDSAGDDVFEAMQRLRHLKDVYSNLNVNDMSIQPAVKESLRYNRRNPKNVDEHEFHETNDDIEEFDANKGINEKDGTKINFSEEVDADVLASRRRYAKNKTIDTNSAKRGQSKGNRRSEGKQDSQRRRGGNKTPLRRGDDQSPQQSSRESSQPNTSRSQSPAQQNKSRPVSAGGAVKSAITRFFNRGSKEQDPYIIDLGIFSEGRPKLEPGIDGIVVPVYDDQPSTIIAHSLSSGEYSAQFNHYIKSESSESGESRRRNSGGDTNTAINDNFPTSSGSKDSRSKHEPNKRGRSQYRNSSPERFDEKKTIERRMLARNKTHIKHTFRDYDEKGQQIAKLVCQTYWATQFQAVRHAFLKDSSSDSSSSKNQTPITRSTSERIRISIEKNYIKSLSTSNSWAASGGKSGASFSKTTDDRFIVKCISRTELQMFLDCAPAYFEYLSKGFFRGLPTMLCKIVGVYQIGYHNRVTGKRTMDQLCVMQNIFFKRKISKVFDLKGTFRNRFAKRMAKDQSENHPANESNIGSAAKQEQKTNNGSDTEASSDDESANSNDDGSMSNASSTDEGEGRNGPNEAKEKKKATAFEELEEMLDDSSGSTLLDGDFLDFTSGRPLPLNDRARATFHMSIQNDTLFLTIINVLDYSILVGIDEEKKELVVGIIDFMRQYDILKQMERVGKSIPMVVGSEAPTIIQPPLYKARFISAMERYFMRVPNKWTVL